MGNSTITNRHGRNVMQGLFEDSISFHTSACDICGVWKTSSLIEAMNIAAQNHHKLYGCDNEMKRLGYTWVLFKTQFEVFRYPKIDEKIKIETFIKSPFLNFIPRYYILKDAEDNTICNAGSLWMIKNTETNAAVNPKDFMLNLPDYSDAIAPINIMAQVQKLNTINEIAAEQKPLFCDLDINGHVNNVIYFDWLCNMLGVDILRNNVISSATVSYYYEVLPSQLIENRLELIEDKFQYSGYSDRRIAFEIVGRLKKREQCPGTKVSCCE